MAQKSTKTATITVEHEPALADSGHNPIDAVVQDPIGFPVGDYQTVLDAVQAEWSRDDLAPGDRVVAGEVVYDETEVREVRL